jgi:hypothetical protein
MLTTNDEGAYVDIGSPTVCSSDIGRFLVFHDNLNACDAMASIAVASDIGERSVVDTDSLWPIEYHVGLGDADRPNFQDKDLST